MKTYNRVDKNRRETRGEHLKYVRIPELKQKKRNYQKEINKIDNLIDTYSREIKEIEKDLDKKIMPASEFLERLKVNIEPNNKRDYPKCVERSRLK